MTRDVLETLEPYINYGFKEGSHYELDSLPYWLEKMDFSKWAEKYVFCCNTVLGMKCSDCGKDSFTIPLRCDLFVCASCAAKRYKKLFRKYYRFLSREGALITFTLENTSAFYNDLTFKPALKNIKSNLRQLVKKYWRGGFISLELSPSGRLHFHVLAFKGYCAQAQLSEEWSRISGSYIVDVRRVGSKRGFNYVLKYACKPMDLTDNKLKAYFLTVLKGNRKLSTFGEMYNINLVKHRLSCPYCNAYYRFDVGVTDTVTSLDSVGTSWCKEQAKERGLLSLGVLAVG